MNPIKYLIFNNQSLKIFDIALCSNFIAINGVTLLCAGVQIKSTIYGHTLYGPSCKSQLSLVWKKTLE